MKKIFIFIICIVLAIVSFVSVKYLNYKANYRDIKLYNLEYEQYLDKEVYGTQIATVINTAVDNNEKNNVEKDEQGFYIENDTNSIKVQIKIIDNETTYEMETLYNGGIERFVQNYNTINFECTQIQYNKAGRVSYMLFEQKTI